MDWIPENKIDWKWLSKNTNDRALDLLEKNMEKIDWVWLSMNTNDRAFDLLEKNMDKNFIYYKFKNEMSKNEELFIVNNRGLNISIEDFFTDSRFLYLSKDSGKNKIDILIVNGSNLTKNGRVLFSSKKKTDAVEIINLKEP